MAGIYTIIVSNSSACTAMATANVIINVTPATPSPNAIAPINSGSSATLTASGCAGTLLWYATIGDVPVTNPVSPSTTTDYYATCQVSANGITCISPRSANVSVTIFSNQIIYVNITNTNPTQNGITWATAFSNLQTGLTTASGISGTSVEVWVAQGTYKPTNTTDRNISFNIPTGVKVYGGFVGTESDISTRDFRTNSSILSGEIGNINSTTDNSRHVVYFDNSNNITTLDGFTITAGNADFDPRFVANLPLPSAPTSTAQTRGGGILIERGSNPLIKNCLIVNNSAVSGGGILAVDGSLPIISYCKIMGNQAAFGPGIYLQDGSNANVSNTLLSGNRGIGAFYNNVSNPTITNCTLSGNGGYNGGIFNSNSQPVIKNSIIWGNSTPFNDTQSVITYSIIQGGYAGVGNLNYDPQFVTQMPDGISPNLAGDYHLRANSLAIDRGDNGTIALTDRDLDRNLRRYAGGQVDMGAFEFQGIATVSLVISVQTGNWETNATWDIGRVPQLGDYVIINTNHTITLNGTGTAKNVESRNNSVIRFGNTSARLNIGF
jgi:parallel beta-helix repeat protein